VVVGETGHGKSTTLVNVFQVVENVKIGYSLSSETWITEPFTASSIFEGTIVFDTPGFHDNRGKADAEILEDIKSSFLKYQGLSGSNHIDATVLVIYPTIKLHLKLYLKEYLAFFSENLLPNLIILFNTPASTPQAVLEQYRRTIHADLASVTAESAFPHLTIPVFEMDCLHPTSEQLYDFNGALNNLQPYLLKGLEEKLKEIKVIFDRMLADQDNYRTEYNQVVEYETQKHMRKQVLRLPDVITLQKQHIQEKSFGIGPISYSSRTPKTISVQEVIYKDVLQDVEEEGQVPVTKQIENKVLKNEHDYYWIMATQEYDKRFTAKFLAGKPRDK